MDYEYDVAISFLSEDEGLARELRDLLAPGLRVFEFTSRQAELAGTDGLVTFKNTFRNISRLVVVLYRNGWGDTPWTRVESEAITDRFLKEGPDFLLFIMVESTAAPPPWLPDRKIRFNFDEFGIDQAAGAIKLRVQDLGGRVSIETIGERAKRAAEAQQFAVETEFLKKDTKGVGLVREEGGKLAATIQALAVEAAAAAPDLGLQWAASNGAVAVRSGRASVYLQLVIRYVNTLDGSFLSVRQMKGNIILPGENRRYLEEPPVVDEVQYEPDRSSALGWCWRSGGKVLSSTELADRAMRRLLERLSGGAGHER